MHDDRLDTLRYGIIARPNPKEFYISTDSFISRNPYKELLNSIYGRRKEADK